MEFVKLKYEPLITASLAKQIAEMIRQSITDGTLKADDQLPTEDALAKQFQVSRPTIREALKRLAAQSLIRSRRGPARDSDAAIAAVTEQTEYLRERFDAAQEWRHQRTAK